MRLDQQDYSLQAVFQSVPGQRDGIQILATTAQKYTSSFLI